ncbi:hypothetical protein BVY04_02350 [bacterium M21]|nr:hypothetical protein BVY04_02350 [bacterium M21]
MFYKLAEDTDKDIAMFTDKVEQFCSGELDAAHFKHDCATRGIYEQRVDGTYMFRIRLSGGQFTPQQCQLIGELGAEYGDGYLHMTTRQNVQIQAANIADAPTVMKRLMPAGLSMRAGGGNTTRNVMTSPFAGICPATPFDILPYAHAITEYMLAIPGSYTLPRKYKISIAGSEQDAGYAMANDLGFVAELRNDTPGFKVYAGGGLGARPRAADLIIDWVPADRVIKIAEAIRRFFDRHGDRTNRAKARLRYVFERLGLETIKKEINQLTREVLADDDVPFVLHETELFDVTDDATPLASSSPNHAHKLTFYRQCQEGLTAVLLDLPHGLISGNDLIRLATIAQVLGGPVSLRATQEQNLLITHVPELALEELSDALSGLEFFQQQNHALNRFVACTGASTCRLGICLSRNVSAAAARALDHAAIPKEILSLIDIRVSGCPNACGGHHLSPIGAFGTRIRHDGHSLPAYQVVLGAEQRSDGIQLAQPIGKIPARALPDFFVALAKDFSTNRESSETVTCYIHRQGLVHFSELAEPFAQIPPYDENPEFYTDWQ